VGGALLNGCVLQQTQRPAPPADNSVRQSVAKLPAPVTPEPEQSTASHRQLEDRPAAQCAEPRDLWSRIRDDFRLLSQADHPRVEAERAWYNKHPAYLDRVAERARPYLHLIVEAVEQRDLPMELALLPVVESAFQPFAYSHGRAAGIWQFIPGTGKRFGLKQSWWYDGRRDIANSTRAALDYLEYLNRHFDGDWLHALAAYNSGEGTVQRAIRRNKSRGRPTDFWSLDLPAETRAYVPKLLAISELVANPPAYGLVLASIPDTPVLTPIDVGSQIDLDLAAELAGMPLEELYYYNPGFNRWATDPDGPHTLLLPIEQAEPFQKQLAGLSERERVNWVRHRIRRGDSLGTIAEQYRTTVALIKQVNRLRSTTIRAGDSLVIPVARKRLQRYTLSAGQRLQRTQARERKGQRIDYLVQEGDTLWEIARKHAVSVRQLASWNGMAPRDTLRPGRKLVIWTADEQRSTSSSPADFVHPFASNTRQRIGYVVRSGDSLARISQRFRVSVENLRRWNNLEESRYLQPGQRLTLFVDVTRQSGAI